MYSVSIDTSRRPQNGRRERLGNDVVQRGRKIPQGRPGRVGPAGGYGPRTGYAPPVAGFVQWTPQAAMSYEQFVNGGMHGHRMSGMGGFPMGGYGAGQIQGVPIGFGVTTS